MYVRDIPHLPTIISRKQFVDTIFEVGIDATQGYDTMLLAVTVGDAFVGSANTSVCTWCQRGSSEDFMQAPVPRVYSTELAHVCLVISGKVNHDRYNRIQRAADNTGNGIVYKLEWEIVMSCHFYIPQPPLLTCWRYLTPGTEINFESEIIREIGYYGLSANPFAVFLAIKMLHRAGRLRSDRLDRENQFLRRMDYIAKELEVSIDAVLRAYITSRKR